GLSCCASDLPARPPVHSFPTRRSSDLVDGPARRSLEDGLRQDLAERDDHGHVRAELAKPGRPLGVAQARGLEDRHARATPSGRPDRKSTRLNSSHLGTSYAVSCLKKKT